MVGKSVCGPFGFIEDPAQMRRDVLELKLLACVEANGELLLPGYQFGTCYAYLPHMREVLMNLDPQMNDGWGDALWLASNPSWLSKGRSIHEAMRLGVQVDVILTRASERYSNRLRQDGVVGA